jgi:hypothetical protein
MTWGVESHVIERFAGAGIPAGKIAFARESWRFNVPGPPAGFVGLFRDYFGPTMNAFEAAAKSGRGAELQKELETLFDNKNESPSRDTTSIRATFLLVTADV